jgi:hypothetical protein
MNKGESVGDWIERQPSPQREILRELRQMIRDTGPELEEKVKWAAPWYEGNDSVVYLASQPKYATFGVCNGAMLNDAGGQLEGTGKSMRHVKVHALDDELRERLEELLEEAVAYDARSGAERA